MGGRGLPFRQDESTPIAAESLDRARHAAADVVGEEIVAAEIRVALDELGKVLYETEKVRPISK